MNSMPPEASKMSKILLWFIFIVFVFLAGFFLGDYNLRSRGNEGQSASENDYLVTGDFKDRYKTVDVDLLWEVWDNLEKEYIESDINERDMLYGAAKGLVSGLNDPYTALLDPEETEEYFNSNKGEFEGIGATLQQDGEFVAVESPLDNSPAQEAGILAGDIILEVDDKDVEGISVYEVAALIRGDAGTTVKVLIFRPSSNERKEFEIVRAKVDLDNIALKDLGDGVYQIKIYKFTEESVEAFNREWNRITEELLAKDPKAIVVDLRNNPGGYVSSVEYALGEFLPKGRVIFMEEDRNGRRVKYEVERTGKFLDIPIIVIVNEGSASASEIFAGAIQDNNRGEIIGQKTVGKGVEQRLIKLSDGSTLQVVFQKWLTPSGKNISKEDPIHPDIAIEDYEEQSSKAKELVLE